MEKPTLSIITVCFQAGEEVQATIENILLQSWRSFEYLVIDGGSSDGTETLLTQSECRFREKSIPFRFISEPDGGIYDAMNKGVRMANGTWLLFLNAGDFLADEQVLEKVFSDPTDAQILYGDTICVYQGNQKLYPALPLERLNREMAFCHQSAFIQRELLLQTPYDISYQVCADHHFFLRMYLSGASFQYLPFPISIYEIAGYSDENIMRAHQEQHQMQRELGIFRPSLSWLLWELRFYLKQGIKLIFGQKLVDRIRKIRLH